MSATPEPERLTQEGFAAFSARTGEDSPVVVLNLLRFKPAGIRSCWSNTRPAKPSSR